MKQRFVRSSGQSRLIILFAGWGMDFRPFETMGRSGYDVMVVWDYRDDSLDLAPLGAYDEICLVAWSFGVYMASRFMKVHPELAISLSIAVNGTLFPVDDRLGIPKDIFEGTLRSLSYDNLMRFYRRMCGGAKMFNAFKAVLPQRGIDDLAEELSRIRDVSSAEPIDDIRLWDKVYVADSDAIIPSANQRAAWHFHPDVRQVEGAHLPQFSRIIHESLIDKDLVRARFGRSVESYDNHASAQTRMAHRLAGLLRDRITAKPHRVIEIGTGTGLFTREYLGLITPCDLLLTDIAHVAPELPGEKEICDGETAIKAWPESSADLIMAACTIQWFNNVSRFIEECHRVLRPGGMAVFSSFGPGTYQELAPLMSHSLTYRSADEYRTMSSMFHTSEIVEEDICIEFPDTASLIRHIKGTGVNAIASGHDSVATVRRLMRSDIRRLTYKPIYILLTKGREE